MIEIRSVRVLAASDALDRTVFGHVRHRHRHGVLVAADLRGDLTWAQPILDALERLDDGVIHGHPGVLACELRSLAATLGSAGPG